MTDISESITEECCGYFKPVNFYEILNTVSNYLQLSMITLFPNNLSYTPSLGNHPSPLYTLSGQVSKTSL